jgi:hypothetical protein
MLRIGANLGTLVLALTVTACSSVESVNPVPTKAAPKDEPAPVEGSATFPTPVGEAEPVAPFPAPHPGMPQMPNNGGPVLHDAEIVTVTFPGDDLESQEQAFDDEIGSLSWWSTVHTEYGINPAKGAGHVTSADPLPDAMSADELEAWLGAKITDGTLPTPNDQTIYALYVPATTIISFSPQEGGGQSCNAFLGYHSAIWTTVNNQSLQVQYAVINRCGDFNSVTETASHEFTEAATDPHPLTNPAYVFLNDNAWTIAGGEDGDLCSMVSSVTENGYSLTRVWSNKNAKAGDQPCIPAPQNAQNLPYFNAGIVKDTTTAHAGDKLQLEVDCYSFGPLPNEFALKPQANSKSILKFTMSQPKCKNGDKVTMTIDVSPNAKKGTSYHYSLSTELDANTGHIWRGMVTIK